MSIARNALLRMSKSHWRADRVMTRGFARKAVKKFMPSEGLSEFLDASEAIAREKLGSLLTRLGENLIVQSEASVSAVGP